MWRYRLPDYELRLLGELQRQQNSSLFCDTLLQSEGVSVPAHSCILAALSPYLSHKLSASPSPSAGQRNQLQLQAVKAHTLLKLVGLLYSGELKGEGTKDQEELLSAARRLGIGCLEEVWRESQREEEVQEEPQSCKRCRKARIQTEELKKREEGRGRDVEVQTGMERRMDGETQVEERVFVDTGTQTVKADGQTMYTSFTFALPSPNKPPEPAPRLAQSCSKGSLLLNPHKITSLQLLSPSLCPSTHSIPAKSNYVHSVPLLETLNMTAAPLTTFHCSVVTEPTSSLVHPTMIPPVAPADDSNYPRPQEGCSHPQSSDSGNDTEELARERRGVEDKTEEKMEKKLDKTEQPSKRAEASKEERRGESVEKRGMTGSAGMKSLARMKQMDMMASTHISIKVKLRRRTRGEVWEVVSMHERDGMLSQVNRRSVLGALKKVGVGRQFNEAVSQEANTVQNTHKDGIKLVQQQRDYTLVQPPPSSPPLSQIQEQETRTLRPVLPTSPNPPPHTNISSDHQNPSCDLHTTSPNTDPQTAIFPQLRGPVEESDEQIEKLLEDIMMGLNILPSVNLERDCNKPQHLQHNHDGAPATCQALIPDHEARQTGTQTVVSSVYCVCCHGYRTGSDDTSSTDTVLNPINSSHFSMATNTSYTIPPEVHPDLSPHPGTGSDTSSTDTGVQCSTKTLSQPKCRSILSVDHTPILTQHQPCSAQRHSSLTYTGEGGGGSCQDTPLSDTQDCPYQEAARVRSVTPTVLYSSDKNSYGLELHYSACQEASSNKVLCLPKLSTHSQGNDAQSPKPYSLPCGEDLSLPKCLSPLEHSPSVAKYHQTAFNHFTSHGERGQQRPLKGQSWLMMNTGIVQFPLSAMVHQEETCPSLQDTTYACQSKRCQSHLVCNNDSVQMDRHSGASKGLSIENEVAEERKMKKFSTACQTVAKLKSKCDRVKERSKQHGDAGDDTQPAKKMRKSLSCTKNSHGQLLDYKEDGRQSKVNMSICSVSLSSNNVLAEDRKSARNPLSMSPKYAGEAKKLSEITERMKRAAKRSRTLRTRMSVIQNAPIRTRGYSKMTQQQGTLSDTCPETPSALGTLAKIVGIMDKVEPPKRKRGRPLKRKLEDLFHPNSAVPSAAHENSNGESIQKSYEYRRGTQELQEMGDKRRQKYRKRLRDKDTEADGMVRSMVQDTQNSEQTLSSCGISALEPNGDQKQNSTQENTNGTKADKEDIISAISPDNILTATKRMPTVTLKEFQELIKHRRFKTRNSAENIETKETSETEENVQSEVKTLDCGKTDSNSDESKKETEMNKDDMWSQDSGAVKTSDAILGTRFNKNNSQIVRADDDRSKKHDEDKIEDTQIKSKKPQSQDLNNNDLPPDTNKKQQEHGKTRALKFLEAMIKDLPLDGTSTNMKPDKMEDPRMTDIDGKIKDDNGQMEAKARKDLELAPLEETGGPEEVGLGDMHRSVIGQMHVEVDFSSEEIVIADEDHPVSCFAAIEEPRGNGEEKKIDVEEEGVTNMGIDGGEEEHLLKYPDKAQNVPKSTSELDTEKSAATIDGLRHSHIHLTKENKVATASNLNPQTPQRRHASIDIHRVTMGSTGSCCQEVEEEEVDILSCSPEKGLQLRESGMGLNLMELIPEEEEDTSEIDVIGEEVSTT